MSAFYKMDPAAWDFGTTDLSLEEEAAYLRIINAIHKHDQPVPDNDRVLAGMFRCSTRKARALLDALLKAGKVRIEDGKITNDRAVSDMVQRGFVSISRAESGAKGGRVRAERAANALKSKEPAQANASSRIEENREEKNPLAPKGDDVAGFEEFWAAWPLAKTAKAKAQAAFKKLKAEDRAKATEAVVTWAANWRRQHPTASDIHATTYLNQKRWEDEATAPKPGLRVVHSGPRIGDVKIINGNPMEYAGNGTGWIRIYA